MSILRPAGERVKVTTEPWRQSLRLVGLRLSIGQAGAKSIEVGWKNSQESFKECNGNQRKRPDQRSENADDEYNPKERTPIPTEYSDQHEDQPRY
jgi:hypothetical protein